MHSKAGTHFQKSLTTKLPFVTWLLTAALEKADRKSLLPLSRHCRITKLFRADVQLLRVSANKKIFS
jgi:hypothetical protein